MKNLDNKLQVKLKKGDKVQYTKTFMFGKTGIEIAKVVLINNYNVLLDNGDTLNIVQ
jgi:hypothetical protein